MTDNEHDTEPTIIGLCEAARRLSCQRETLVEAAETQHLRALWIDGKWFTTVQAVADYGLYYLAVTVMT